MSVLNILVIYGTTKDTDLFKILSNKFRQHLEQEIYILRLLK